MKTVTVSEFLDHVKRAPKPKPVAPVRSEHGQLWRAIHRLLDRNETQQAPQ